ncbi:MAG: uroporphyrinogen-III C-methyltransferase [Steroidobacteraceae bacterium]|jgi:uncharacterized protein HemX|nr:uroporphyrinogen-III C-methyltransferase [Steroidobacteraceae bacterium]
MAENGPDSAHTPARAVDSSAPRRAHTYSRLTTAVAVLALAIAAYALWRLDATRDRLEAVSDATLELQSGRAALEAELQALATDSRQSRRDLARRVDALGETPRQLQELASSVEELRGRTQGPERAWSRAEALFLLELAQRRLALERDVETAIVALESADARLAALRDSSFEQVRRQIARELQALRSVRGPDVTSIMARLGAAEEHAMRAPVKGVVTAQREAVDHTDLPDGPLARAWAVTRRALANLVVIRRVDQDAGRLVTEHEALLRRQHLQLLLFAARTAAARHDGAEYRRALAGARRWLGEFFDLSGATAQALLREIQALEPIDVDPPTPDVSGSLRELQRLTPTPQAGPTNRSQTSRLP